MAEELGAVGGIEPVTESQALHRVERDGAVAEASANARADERAELRRSIADALRVAPSRVWAHEDLVAALAGFGDRKPFRVGEEGPDRARPGHGIAIVAVPGQVAGPGDLESGGAPLLESR